MGEWGCEIKNVNRSVNMVFYSTNRCFMEEECIRYLLCGRCAIIICFLKGAAEASMSNCSFGEYFLTLQLYIFFYDDIG